MKRWLAVLILAAASSAMGPVQAQPASGYEVKVFTDYRLEDAYATGGRLESQFRVARVPQSDGRVAYDIILLDFPDLASAQAMCPPDQPAELPCDIRAQPPVRGPDAPLPASYQVAMAGYQTWDEALQFGIPKGRPWYIETSVMGGVRGYNVVFTEFPTRDEAAAFCNPLPEFCAVFPTSDPAGWVPPHAFTTASVETAPPARVTGIDVTQLFLCQSSFEAALAAARRLRVTREDEEQFQRHFAVGDLVILGQRPIEALQDTISEAPGLETYEQTYQAKFALYRSELLALIRARVTGIDCDSLYAETGGCGLPLRGYATLAGRYLATGQDNAYLLVAGTMPGDDRRESAIRCNRATALD